VTAGRPRRHGALVLGSDYKALGIVRSLGRHSIPVWVLNDEHRLAGWSRYAGRTLDWPQAESERVEFLLGLCATEGLDGWALFPTGDDTAALLARHHAALGARYRLTVSAWDVLRWAYDKRLTYRLAADLGVDHPRTFYPRSREDVLGYAGGFPAILKPAIRPAMNRFTIAKAWPVEDRAGLVARYDEACALIDPSLIMIQELVAGGGDTQLSYAALCRSGRPIASLTARRTRQWPMDFGRASTFVETVVAPDVEQVACRVLATIGLDGIVEVEFKRDARGRLMLLDVNARVWGWHTLGRAAGVDFPFLLWRMANGEGVPASRGRPGVRWVRALTDVPTVLGEIRAGRLGLAEYLRSLRGPIEYAVLAPDDPLPALIEVPLSLRLAWERRANGGDARAEEGNALAMIDARPSIRSR
jgi:predicted ATP-grasp superfamily ATP-dependent carboligase